MATLKQSKRYPLDRTACIFVFRNLDKDMSLMGFTQDIKKRLNQQNNEVPKGMKGSGGHWVPVCALTGFKTRKEAMTFEFHVKRQLKQREYNDYVKLYAGQLGASTIKRILAMRCLLCEQERWWQGKKRRYVIHWASEGFPDQLQYEKLRTNWGRMGWPVEHIEMVLDGLTYPFERKLKLKAEKAARKAKQHRGSDTDGCSRGSSVSNDVIEVSSDGGAGDDDSDRDSTSGSGSASADRRKWVNVIMIDSEDDNTICDSDEYRA